MWIFDTTDGDARLLRFRSGHSAPPLCIRMLEVSNFDRFYGNGRYILSAGQDRAFRLFSIIQEQQSRELSQRHVTKRAKKLRTREEEIKLKPVITFDFAEIRERDWCNVVTCHMDTPQAYVWRLQNFVIGEHILSPSADIQTPIKAYSLKRACAISACGNFAILGTNGGWIERFNLQSGISRGTYVDISESRQYAHDGEVVGIACDATNSSMISAGYNGDIKVNNVKKLYLLCSIGLLATVAEDMVIRLYDVVALRMVRKFEGHNDRITDLCFSDDGKWLLSSSMDGTLRVWDVILAKQIDAISVGIPITALSLSPLMDVLVTSHVDQNGIYLWVNQAMFSGVSKMDSYALGSQVRSVEMPTVASNGGANKEETLSAENVDAIHNAYTIPQLDKQMPNLITLSLLPRSQWQSLTNLDIIKVRNKPIEPPKKPEKAPFFLPSVPTLSGQILFEPNSEGTAGKDKENMKNKKGMPLSSHFILLLNSCAETKNFSAFTDYIKGLSPSDLDLELRILQIVDEDNLEKLDQRQPELQSIGILLDYLIHELSSRNNFELIQAVIKLFLKIHGETLRHHSLLQEKAKRLLEVQSTVWQRIDKMFQSARCMVTFLSNSQF
ncbi:hypothetical protein ZIOFF_064343 [Zingiber officinale]|uniref:WDR36/Utp21 C-terminal domain-containing protein n=1 Tax=Zingiber officinale TaxID=94328 RepID=A0A8J5K888_ZINOF|nr:hypothetical protein ZIOFF_064343 [Zingiber officinale]